MKTHAALALAAALSTTGCFSYPMGEVTLLSTAAVPVDLRPSKTGIVGEQCGIDGLSAPQLQAVVEAMLRDAPGTNALTNVKVEMITRSVILLQQRCLRIEGDAVYIPPPDGGTVAGVDSRIP